MPNVVKSVVKNAEKITINKYNRDTQSPLKASLSKHRLSEISHHFLSDENERTPVWQNTSIIPVLLSSKHDDHIVYELDRAFNRAFNLSSHSTTHHSPHHSPHHNSHHRSHQKNGSSMVLNIESCLASKGISATFLDKNSDTSIFEDKDLIDQEGRSGDSEMPDICLVPITSPSTTMALQNDRFIIVVHASLTGVRIAYEQLSFMASLNTDFTVCVIMLGARNMHEARRFFGFLCDSAQSLLTLNLECGGIILDNRNINKHKQTTNDEVAQQAMNNLGIATHLEGVAEGILRKFKATTKRTSVASLSSPVGPAALLS